MIACQLGLGLRQKRDNQIQHFTLTGTQPRLLEHEAARWLPKDQLRSVRWLPADLSILDLL